MAEKKKIIIVDDDTMILDVIKAILEGEGYEISIFCDLNIFPSVFLLEPDLIIIDVMLEGGKDGRKIVRNLRKISDYARLPVIMMSAQSHFEESALGSGANRFLSKPFGIEELLSIVQNTLHN